MAILGKCEARVIIQGEIAKEHDDEDTTDNDNHNIVTKYIEAVSGAF